MTATPSASATHIAEWMLEAALATTSAVDAFDGMVRRLRDHGVQVDRAHIAHTTLHPLVKGTGATWTVKDGLVTEDYTFDRDELAAGWFDSPIHHAIKTRTDMMRRRLAGPGATLDFPVLKGFAAQGYTDYMLSIQAFESFFSPPSVDIEGEGPDIAGMSISYATRREGGFTAEEIETLHWLRRPLGMAVKMADQRQVAVNLAECYIGHQAGPRVLGGDIRRGDFASTDAVVFMADLRASTELSMTLSSEDYVATINRFFDCAVGAVEAEGGEPLTFIGDGVLAIFPTAEMGEAGARKAALRAAHGAAAALDALNAERADDNAPPLRWGVALHAGVMEYGNIGSPTRHSWSVIGPVVNETARLEAMTKTLGEPILASRAFAEALDPPWRPQGAHTLRGVAVPFEIFAPPAQTKELA